MFPQILTKDAVTVAVEAVIYYRISDASAVVNQLENHRQKKRDQRNLFLLPVLWLCTDIYFTDIEHKRHPSPLHM